MAEGAGLENRCTRKGIVSSNLTLSVTTVCALVLAVIPRNDATAQTSDSARANAPLFVRTDPYVLGAFAVATIAMFPLDKHLASQVRDEDLLANKKLMQASHVFRFFGGTGPYIIGGAMYAVGRAARLRRVTQLGVHGTEGVVVGASISGVLKLLLGRARPYTTADTNPRNFGVGRGIKGSDYQSFPSGHSTSAFAAAAAVSAEMAEWWPHQRWVFNPILYTGASLVGLSRIYEDKHWASDVVMGAAIGSFAGLKVVRFNHTHEGNRIDRFLMGSMAARPSSLQMYFSGRETLHVQMHRQF